MISEAGVYREITQGARERQSRPEQCCSNARAARDQNHQSQPGGSESFKGLTVTFPEDPGLWTESDITHALWMYFSQKKIEQDLDALDLTISAKIYDYGRIMYLNKVDFLRNFVNEEKVRNRCMISSESSGMPLWHVCELFASKQSALTIGFNDRTNIHHLLEHENSIMHRKPTSACCSSGQETGQKIWHCWYRWSKKECTGRIH